MKEGNIFKKLEKNTNETLNSFCKYSETLDQTVQSSF